MNYQVKYQFTLVQQFIFGLDGVDAYQRGFMHFGAIRPKWQASNELAPKVFDFTMDTPSLPERA
jgi:hypothetical protein